MQTALVLAVLITSGCGGGGAVANQTPAITALNPSATTVQPDHKVFFNANATDPDGDPLTYKWGATGGQFDKESICNPTWSAPAVAGAYEIRLQVSDGRGGTAALRMTITVTGGGAGANQAPTITALNPSATTVAPNGPVAFDASATDPDGDALKYGWTAAGGTFNSTIIPNPTWTAPATAGDYQITLQVSDGRGGTATQSVTITVTPGAALQFLFYEDFESGLDGWFDHEYSQRMYITDQTAYAGNHCLEMVFRPGDGEVGPGWMYRRFFPARAGTPQETEGVEEVYLRVFQRWSPNWQWPRGGDGPHNLYLLAGDVDGLATTELTVYLEIRSLHPLAMICGAHQDIDYQDWEATGAVPIELDRWYCLEIRAKMNDPGQSNGIIQVWLDNQQVLDVRNVMMRQNRIGLDGTTLSFHEMAIGPWYHDGIYSQEPMHIWMDELAVSTQRIGMATLTTGGAAVPE